MTSNRGPGTRPPREHDRGPGGLRGTPARLVDLGPEVDHLCTRFRQRADAEVAATIAAHGWALHAIDGEADVPGFVHTIGLSAFDEHPELLVIGLRSGAAAALLDVLGEQVRAGDRLRDRRQCTDFPGWPRIALLEVDPDASAALLTSANRRYQPPDGPPVRALQVVWCDPTGAMPWEPGWVLPRHGQPLAHVPYDPFADDEEDDVLDWLRDEFEGLADKGRQPEDAAVTAAVEGEHQRATRWRWAG
jgi:hypothetical protein